MKRFYALIRKLRKAYPQFTVQVRRKPQADFGHTWQLDDEQRFRITIRKDLNEDAAIDTLIHEWAHVPSYEEWERTGVEHNPVWAYHQGECYRIYEEHFL
jgi:hypothetical protein